MSSPSPGSGTPTAPPGPDALRVAWRGARTQSWHPAAVQVPSVIGLHMIDDFSTLTHCPDPSPSFPQVQLSSAQRILSNKKTHQRAICEKKRCLTAEWNKAENASGYGGGKRSPSVRSPRIMACSAQKHSPWVIGLFWASTGR